MVALGVEAEGHAVVVVGEGVWLVNTTTLLVDSVVLEGLAGRGGGSEAVTLLGVGWGAARCVEPPGVEGGRGAVEGGGGSSLRLRRGA